MEYRIWSICLDLAWEMLATSNFNLLLPARSRLMHRIMVGMIAADFIIQAIRTILRAASRVWRIETFLSSRSHSLMVEWRTQNYYSTLTTSFLPGFMRHICSRASPLQSPNW